MSATTETPAASSDLAPITVRERIQALDVIRGFALIGIFLMNIEWFARPIADLGTGVDANQTGLSYAASWLIHTLVAGKFWTMFSLLFGMGFAVMLTRAEDNERAFVTPYLRRIIALFLFGSMHFVMIWTGDILHIYALTALLLLMIVTRGWKAWFAIFLSIAAVGFSSGSESWWATGAFLALSTMAGWLVLRGEIDHWIKLLGLVLAAAAGVFALGESSEGMAASCAVMAIVAVFIYFLNRGSIARYWKFGVTLYLLPFVVMLLFTLGTMIIPAMKPTITPEQEKQRTENLAERASDRAAETKLFTTGSYAEAVRFRAREYSEELPQMAEGGMFTLSMFLIGFWFVRAGVMGNLRKHQAFFRRLLAWTLPVGLAITLTSVLLHPTFVPGTGRDPVVRLARILFEIGALPLCIAYVSGLVCLMGTGLGARLLSPLAYAGRMALTNYLGASVIASTWFYGYGLGHFGQDSRAEQVLFVAVAFSLQLLASAWWLSRFRYGPMEWLWRAITYWQLPPMRREAPIAAPGMAGA